MIIYYQTWPVNFIDSLRGDTLKTAIKEDQEKGLIPFCLIATLGTTACLAFDNIMELGPICQAEKVNNNKEIGNISLKYSIISIIKILCKRL